MMERETPKEAYRSSKAWNLFSDGRRAVSVAVHEPFEFQAHPKEPSEALATVYTYVISRRDGWNVVTCDGEEVDRWRV